MLGFLKRFLNKRFFTQDCVEIKKDRNDKALIILQHEKYDYLTPLTKKYITENIDDIIVQDPLIDKNPAILFIKNGYSHLKNVRSILGL